MLGMGNVAHNAVSMCDADLRPVREALVVGVGWRNPDVWRLLYCQNWLFERHRPVTFAA